MAYIQTPYSHVQSLHSLSQFTLQACRLLFSHGNSPRCQSDLLTVPQTHLQIYRAT